MGNENSKTSDKQIKNSQPTQTTQTKISKKSQFNTIQRQGNIELDTINGDVIQYGNILMYFSQNTDNNHKSSHHIIKLNKYDLTTKQIISSIEINTSPYKIDISNSVYCINTQNNAIYLINKNTQIFIISINGNPSIQPSNFIVSENKNIATIAYCNNAVTVIGGIPKTEDNDEKSQYKEKSIRYISFDKTIKKFGNDCAVIEIKELDRIILMGGKTDKHVPSRLIWLCSINNITDGPFYLPEPMHSFGFVHLNLEECRWLLLFGGTHVDIRKEEEAPMNTVYAIYLDKTYEKLSFQELMKIGVIKCDNESQNVKKGLGPKLGPRKKNNGSQNKDVVTDVSLHGLWIEMKLILPEEADYDAFYNEHVDKDTIHLINKKNGNHYTIDVNELLQLLETSKLFRKDGGTARRCQKWTDY